MLAGLSSLALLVAWPASLHTGRSSSSTNCATRDVATQNGCKHELLLCLFYVLHGSAVSMPPGFSSPDHPQLPALPCFIMLVHTLTSLFPTGQKGQHPPLRSVLNAALPRIQSQDQEAPGLSWLTSSETGAAAAFTKKPELLRLLVQTERK